MLTPSYLQEIPKSVVAIYSELENEIITYIARVIAKANYLTPSAEWQIYKAQQLSYTYEKVIKEVAKLTARSEKEITRLFKESAITALKYDDAIYNEAFKKGIITNKPLPLVRSPQMVALLRAGINQTNGLLKNFTQTTAINVQRQLSEALDLAYMQITSGAFSPQHAIRNAVKTIADAGIKAFNYSSGHTDQVEVAVRRAVVTGINQTTSKMQIARADEMGCDLVEVSSHFGARPSHAGWQGGIYSRSGKHPKYPDFVSSTGYGSGDGLCGWNCYHNFYPYFEGLSSSSFTKYDKEANDKAYEQSQMQRKLERAVREEKRKCVAYNAAGDTEMFNKHAVRLKAKEKELKDFLVRTGRYRDRDREQVMGFNRSVSSKAVWAKRKDDEKLVKFAKIDYNVYEKAKKGGAHSGTYKALQDMDDKQVLKSIKSFDKNVLEHEEKIKNPSMHVSNWEGRSDQYKQGIIRKWKKDIERNRQQGEIAKGVAIERGLNYE